MECMAASKPVIASNVGGIPEIVEDGVNGYIVSPYNYKKTAYCIMDLLNNPKKAKEMGLIGRKMIEKKFNMETSIKKLIKTYKRLQSQKNV